MGHWHEIQKDLAVPTRELRAAIPDAWKAFSQLHQASMAEGAIPARIKEVIALAIAVSEQCDGCIAYHASSAARGGATEAEVAEGLGVALLMNGGPATVYGPRAWAAFQEFRDSDGAM